MRVEGQASEAPPAPLAHVRREDDLIFDIGMNTGEDTDFYLRKGFRVVAVEANPVSCKAAGERFADEISAGRLTILNRAISNGRERLRFFVCRTQSAWSTASERLRDQWARQGAVFEEIAVPGMSSADLIEERGVPYYAKIDIEGFDLVCLNGFRNAGAAPDYVSVEVDFYTVDQLIGMLSELGYCRFALVGQRGVGRLSCTIASGSPYAFREGCSGPFGEELHVPWEDLNSIRAKCRAVIWQHKLSGTLNWFNHFPPLERSVEWLAWSRLPLAQDWYDLHAGK
jgi:FkbM family methyltransferase